MNTMTQPLPPEIAAIPRVALFLSKSEVQQELERILREKYSSLMLITDKAKLAEFSIPLVVLVDTIKDVAEIRALHPVEGTQVLVVLEEGDSEIEAAAFDAGADDHLVYPFSADAVVGKIEKYLEAFRG
jgi:DNA-binding response OmpR family regulator